MTIEITAVEAEGRDFADTVEAIVDGAAARLGKPFEPEQLQLKATDADGRLVGGLTAHTVQGWLFIKLLGIAEGQRGNGIGRLLLSKAEDFARQKGLVGVYLDFTRVWVMANAAVCRPAVAQRSVSGLPRPSVKQPDEDERGRSGPAGSGLTLNRDAPR